MRRPIKYSLSLQKKGNCSKKRNTNQCVNDKINTTTFHAPTKKINDSPYLAHPVHYHGSCGWTLLQNGCMYKHVIPRQSNIIIPKEIPHQLRCSILKNGTASVLWRSGLANTHQNLIQLTTTCIIANISLKSKKGCVSNHLRFTSICASIYSIKPNFKVEQFNSK